MLHVRDMREADIEVVSAIRVRGWQSAYAGIVPQPYLDALTVRSDADRRRTWFSGPDRQSADLVAVDAGVPAGWLSFGRWRGQEPGRGRPGEIYAFYVRPDLTGRGIGRLLLTHAHERMEERFSASLLWVLRDNHRARRFYEAAGYTADGGARGDVYDDVTLTELRYQRRL